MYKPVKTVRIEKSEPRWVDGVWLGLTVETHEHIIGTSKGVIKCRAISAVEESRKFNKQVVEEIKGVPWQPVPNRRSNKIPTRIQEDEDDEDEEKMMRGRWKEEDMEGKLYGGELGDGGSEGWKKVEKRRKKMIG